MAFTSIEEQFAERTAAITATEGRHVTRVFQALSNSNLDGPYEAINLLGINIGDQYLTLNALESDQFSYCYSITASQIEGDYLGWRLIVQYGPYSCLFAGGGPTQNPLLQPIDVKWGWKTNEVVADIDINGNAILNTAGDPYDPPLVEEDPRMLMTVVRNEAVINPQFISQYIGAINADTFAGFQPLFAKCLSIEPESVFHQSIGWYYQVTYHFEFIPPMSMYGTMNGYRRTVLNQGFNSLNASTGVRTRVTFNGLPVTEPVLLDQQGRFKVNNTNVPFYNIYKLRPELQFTSVFNFDPLAISGQRTAFNTSYGPQ